MAEINTATTGHKAGGKRSKKLSTRVDLTPMVDLGFLLITFFIITTAMSEPQATKLIMPDDSKDPSTDSEIGKSAALTVLPLSHDKIFYYHGELSEAVKSGAYGFSNYNLADGIGQVVREKQLFMDRMKPNFRKDLTLMIKPSPESHYNNVVDMLDEAKINAVSRFMIMDITEEERKIILEKNGSL